MKIEKKMIALSIVAFAIGIAVIAPMSALMNTKAQTFGDEPWFTIENPSASFAADIIDDMYHYTGGIKFLTSISDNAFNQQADARIEYLKLVIYTGDIKLCETNQFIVVANSHNNYGDTCRDLLEFGSKNWFNDLIFLLGTSGSYGSSSSGGNCLHSTQLLINDYGSGSCGGGSYDNTYKEFGAILNALENTQTIYADIIRVGYITFYENEEVVVTPIDNEVIQHMELTKNGNGFTFNDSAPIQLPVPRGLEDIKNYLGIEP